MIIKNKQFQILIFVALLGFWYCGAILSLDSRSLLNKAIKSENNVTYAASKLQIFPTPKIIVSDLHLPNQFKTNEAVVTISPVSLLLFRPKVENIAIDNITYRIDHDEFTFNNHNLIIDLLLHYSKDFTLDINKIFLVNSKEKILSILTNMLTYNGSVKFFTQDKLEILIKQSSVESGEQYKIIVHDDGVSFHLTEIYQDKLLKSGNIDILFGQDRKKHYGLNFVNSGEGKYIISPAADSIKIQGSYQANLTSASSSNLDINIEEITLGHLDPQGLQHKFFKYFDFIAQNLHSNLSIDKVYSGAENINNFRISLFYQPEHLEIKHLYGDLEPSGHVEFNGHISHNQHRSILEGDLKLLHTNIAPYLNRFDSLFAFQKELPTMITSSIAVTELNVRLQNINGTIAGTNITGNFDMKNIGAIPRISTNLDIRTNNTSFEEVNYLQGIYRYIISLTENIDDNDYLNKYVPIRNIDYTANIALKIDNSKATTNKLNNLNMLVEVEKGRINLDSLYLLFGSNNIHLSCNLDLLSPIPQYKLRVTGGKLLGDMSSELLNSLKNYISNADLDQKLKIAADIKLDELQINESSFKNVDMKLNNDNQVINIVKFNADFLGGDLKALGHIIPDSAHLNIVYGIDSLSVRDYMNLILPNINIAKGYASISGRIDLINCLDNKVLDRIKGITKFAANKLQIQHFSPDTFIQRLGSQDYKIDALDQGKKLIYSGSDVMTNLRGEYVIDKGKINLSNLSFNTNYSAVKNSGTIDLKNDTLAINSEILFFLDDNANSNQAENYSVIRSSITGRILSPDISIVSTNLGHPTK